MTPLSVQMNIETLVPEEKWERFVEWQEREHVTAEPQPSLRARLLRKGGETLIAAGRKLEQYSGIPTIGDGRQQFSWEK